MVAVFCKTIKEFRNLDVSPKRVFKRITDVNDIRGRNFIGIIRIGEWYDRDDLVKAYEYLQLEQPELFNK